MLKWTHYRRPSLSCFHSKVYHWRTKPRGQEDSKVILTDAAITNALNQTVQSIREGDLEQAQAGHNPAWAAIVFVRTSTPLSAQRFELPARRVRTGEVGGSIGRVCVEDDVTKFADSEIAHRA
jgi:hypothetical protein